MRESLTPPPLIPVRSPLPVLPSIRTTGMFLSMKRKTWTRTLLIVLASVVMSTADSRRPLRIVSLAPIVTEQLVLLGADDRLVGVTAYCPSLPAGRRAETVGNIVEISAEKVLLLKPDLVLISDINARSGTERLVAAGLRVESVPEGHDLDSILDGFVRLGRLLGQETKARTLATAWRREARTITPLRTSPKPRVLAVVSHQPLVVAGRRSFLSSLITSVGAENAVTNSEPWLRYSAEEVLRRPADLVLLILDPSAVAEAEAFWRRHDLRTAAVDPDLFSRATPPRFIQAARTLRDLLGR